MINYTGNVTLDEPSTIGYRLWKLGHQHNPKYPTGIDPTDPEEALHLGLTDEGMELGVLSYMEWFEVELDELVQKHHNGRHLDKNGQAGPAFVELLNQPRCGHADYMALGRQEANWPDTCRDRLIIGRNFPSLPGSTQERTHGIWWASANNWTWALADMAVTVADVGDRNAHVLAMLKALSGSVLAWSFLAQNDCRAKLDQAYNTRVDWGDDDFAAAVKSHEDGHAWGLPHNNDRDALMYPQIHSRSVARAGYPNATDLRVARGLGYRLSDKSGPPPRDKLFLPRPWDEPDDPPDPPDPPGPVESLYLKGTVTAVLDGKEWPQQFTLTPKPQA